MESSSNTVKLQPGTPVSWWRPVLAFLVPVSVIVIYFIFRGVFPFGNSTVLISDLGQQYVDFLAYLRRIILSFHSDGFFFSFQKALGGEMFSVWAYYLLSPLNLILLFCPGKWLPFGIWVVTALKYGLAGLSMWWYLKAYHLPTPLQLAVAWAYALNGWMIANQLNIMWLDALIILPLIIKGIDQLFAGKSCVFYSIWLAVILLINYYMAYMIILFSILYVIFKVVEQSNYPQAGKSIVRALEKYGIGSLLSIGLASIVLLPTFFAITESKGMYTKIPNLTNQKNLFAPELQLGKLIVGAFNFKQLPGGNANIFLSAVLFLGALLYLLNERIPWRNRVCAFLISDFLIISFWSRPLTLIWHGLQMPRWYPSRFSFVLVFFVLLLFVKNYQHYVGISPFKLTLLVVLCSAVFGYLMQHLSRFSYLNVNKIGFTICCTILGLLILLCVHNPRMPWLLSSLILLEMIVNAATTLNSLSYLTQSDYYNYVQTVQQSLEPVTHHQGFFRLEKTFRRSHNDALQLNYNGATHFDSAFEQQTPTLMGKLGNPKNRVFVEYTNGTPVTDSLLGMKYYLAPTAGTPKHNAPQLSAVVRKPDLKKDYRPVFTQKNKPLGIQVYQNQFALPLAFMSSQKILDFNMYNNFPLNLQQNLFNALTGAPNTNPIFSIQKFSGVDYNNVQKAWVQGQLVYQRIVPDEPAVVHYTFNIPNQNSYYLTLPAGTNRQATITINGQLLNQPSIYNNPIVINLAANDAHDTVKIDVQLKQQTLNFNQFQLYQLNQAQYQSGIKHLQSAPLHITHFQQQQIRGWVQVSGRRQLLFTSIPYSRGWHVQVDGHPVVPKKTCNFFLTVPLQKGKHRVSFNYQLPYLRIGIVITLCSLLILSSLIINDHYLT